MNILQFIRAHEMHKKENKFSLWILQEILLLHEIYALTFRFQFNVGQHGRRDLHANCKCTKDVKENLPIQTWDKERF